MLNGFSTWLIETFRGRGWWVVVLGGVTAVWFVHMAWVGYLITGERSLLDSTVPLLSSDIAEKINGYSQDIRNNLRWFYVSFDFVLPALYAAFFSAAISGYLKVAKLGGARWNLLPISAALVDYIENAGFFLLLGDGSVEVGFLTNAAAIASGLKWLLFVPSFVLSVPAIYHGIKQLFAWLRTLGSDSPSGSEE